MSSHQVPLTRGWSLWRWVWLRGAGLPADLLGPLASPSLAAAADQLRARDAEVAAARHDAIVALERAIEPLEGDARKPLGRALKKLRQGALPAPDSVLAAARQPIEVLHEVHERLSQAHLDAERIFDLEETRISDAVRAVANDALFREACLWQNRDAVRTAVDRVREGRASKTSQHRQHEQLVARYLQRYCVKNDTIGFFGPVGWASFVETEGEGDCSPGAALLAKRTVYFEHWAIEALANRISHDAPLRKLLPPRRSPTLYVADGRVYRGASPLNVPRQVEEVLLACDGNRTAQAAAELLLLDPRLGFDSCEDVYEVLEDLDERGLVLWRLEVPTFLARPEDSVRRQLDLAGDVGRQALACLNELESARDAVQRAAGDPDALVEALTQMDRVFEEHARSNATRRSGEMYAARTVVYEDCQRALSLRIGPQLIQRIARPLSLVLQSARWYTFTIAEQLRARLSQIYGELCDRMGTQVIDYASFYDRAVQTLPSVEDAGFITEITAELSRRWAEILRLDRSRAREHRSADTLEPLVDDWFAAPHAGWAGATCHEIDLLIAATTPEEAFATGTVVIGELHPACNLAMRPALSLKESQAPDVLVRAYEQDIPGPGVALLLPKTLTTHATAWSPTPRDYDIELGATKSPRPRSHVIAAADLVVEHADDRLWIRTRDGRARFDIVAPFEYPLMRATTFRMLDADSHVPRVTIDQLVVQREQWKVSGAELPFTGIERGYKQFAAVRAWAKGMGLPRWIFVKAPHERKPVYVDFESPIYVDIFTKLARRASTLVLSEMLPSPSETWLPDSAGQRYTCELRIAAVDPHPWPSSR
jgi:hypothetical protein